MFEEMLKEMFLRLLREDETFREEIRDLTTSGLDGLIDEKVEESVTDAISNLKFETTIA